MQQALSVHISRLQVAHTSRRACKQAQVQGVLRAAQQPTLHAFACRMQPPSRKRTQW